MKIAVKVFLLGLVLATVSTGAAAQQHALRQQLEQWAERCSNTHREHEPDAVVRACTSIIRSDQATSPVRAFAYYQRGAVRLGQGDQAQALADFTSAIDHDPHYMAAYATRGALYVARGEFDQAVADYDQVVRLSPDFAGAYNARCWLRATAGRGLDQARLDCDRAIQLGGGADAHDSRGFLNLRELRFEDAWRDYDAAVAADPRNAHFLYGRGIAALRLQRTTEGQADLSAALAADPGVAALYESYGVTP